MSLKLIRMDGKNESIKFIDKVLIFVQLLTYMIPAIESNKYIYLFVLIFVTIRGLLILASYHKIGTFYEKWLMLFVSILFITGILGINIANSLDLYKTIGIRMVFIWYIFLVIHTVDDINLIIKYYIAANIIMLLFIIFNVSVGDLIHTKLGSEVLGKDWNANSIGFTLAVSMALLFYLRNRHRKSKKLFCTILMFIMGVFLIITQSKTSILSIFTSILVYLYVKNRKKTLYFLKRFFFISIVLYFLLQIPYVQENIVSHFIGAFKTILDRNSDENIADRSSYLRIMMIQCGINWFKSRPILGYGISNYSILFAKTPINIYGTGGTYSHNNYIELLVCTGIIGFIVYYSIYMIVIRKLAVKKNETAYLLIAILIMFLVTDISRVSYYSVHNLLFVTLASKIVSINGVRKSSVLKLR